MASLAERVDRLPRSPQAARMAECARRPARDRRNHGALADPRARLASRR
jgi:hypothetical protein